MCSPSDVVLRGAPAHICTGSSVIVGPTRDSSTFKRSLVPPKGAVLSWDGAGRARRGAAVGCSVAAPRRDSAAVLVSSRQHIEREHRGRWRSVRWRYRPHQRRSAPPASCSQCATERLLTGCLRLRAGRDHHPDGGQLRLPERSRMPLGRHLRRAARRAPLHSV